MSGVITKNLFTPEVAWHATAAENALSIRRRGLLARYPSDHNYPHIENHKGAYVTKNDPINTVSWWAGDMSERPRGNVLVVVNILGLERIVDDCAGGECYCIPGGVPADRILGISPPTTPLNMWDLPYDPEAHANAIGRISEFFDALKSQHEWAPV